MKNKTPKRLRKYRMDAGYTIYTLADKLEEILGKGVHYSSISYWENGEKVPRIGTIVALEDLFNVGYRELFSDLTDDEIKELDQRLLAARKGEHY
ncbi:transcriptional regulator [Bacillus phage Mater]|uniref:Transcriptional regulator n=1 Tax=Bacillus phage Mater TaxID=1540090 RepID=A0A0A0RUT5_9CAUD|nr:transcriptional regulator [Bacillus phage Mater]AIW03343.1 transcriptional regulator [Bacillus phage Mater]